MKKVYCNNCKHFLGIREGRAICLLASNTKIYKNKYVPEEAMVREDLDRLEGYLTVGGDWFIYADQLNSKGKCKDYKRSWYILWA